MGYGGFVSRLGYVPHLDTALATSVHILRWVGHGDGADNFAMGKSVDLTAAPWDPLSGERVVGEGYRL